MRLASLTPEQRARAADAVRVANRAGRAERALEDAKGGIVPPRLAAAIRKRHQRAERNKRLAELGGIGSV